MARSSAIGNSKEQLLDPYRTCDLCPLNLCPILDFPRNFGHFCGQSRSLLPRSGKGLGSKLAVKSCAKPIRTTPESVDPRSTSIISSFSSSTPTGIPKCNFALFGEEQFPALFIEDLNAELFLEAFHLEAYCGWRAA